jgi:hypothetical protein
LNSTIEKHHRYYKIAYDLTGPRFWNSLSCSARKDRRCSVPKLTSLERKLVLERRVEQLSHGAEAYVSEEDVYRVYPDMKSKISHEKFAEVELALNMMPIGIRRFYPESLSSLKVHDPQTILDNCVPDYLLTPTLHRKPCEYFPLYLGIGGGDPEFDTNIDENHAISDMVSKSSTMVSKSSTIVSKSSAAWQSYDFGPNNNRTSKGMSIPIALGWFLGIIGSAVCTQIAYKYGEMYTTKLMECNQATYTTPGSQGPVATSSFYDSNYGMTDITEAASWYSNTEAGWRFILSKGICPIAASYLKVYKKTTSGASGSSTTYSWYEYNQLESEDLLCSEEQKGKSCNIQLDYYYYNCIGVNNLGDDTTDTSNIFQIMDKTNAAEGLSTSFESGWNNYESVTKMSFIVSVLGWCMLAFGGIICYVQPLLWWSDRRLSIDDRFLGLSRSCEFYFGFGLFVFYFVALLFQFILICTLLGLYNGNPLQDEAESSWSPMFPDCKVRLEPDSLVSETLTAALILQMFNMLVVTWYAFQLPKTQKMLTTSKLANGFINC